MVVHLIAAGKLENPNKWPELWHHCYNIWKSSPYEIKLWGDKDIDQLLKEDDEEFFNILNNLPPIYKWDYVRYLILEKFGGAYFDMDIEIVRDFLPLLHPEKIYFMGGKINEYVQNSIMISLTPKTQTRFWVWQSLKNTSKFNILNNIDKAKIEHYTLDLVGPLFLSKWLAQNSKYLEEMNIKYELLSHHHFCSLTNEVSFARHHHASLWQST